MQRDDIRKKLVAMLHGLTDQEWGLLEEKGFVEGIELHESEDAIDDAVRETRLNRKAYKTAATKAPPMIDKRKFNPKKRFDVISVLLADMANEEPEVKNFRNQMLGNQLIEVGDVEPWLHKRRTDELELKEKYLNHNSATVQTDAEIDKNLD